MCLNRCGYLISRPAEDIRRRHSGQFPSGPRVVVRMTRYKVQALLTLDPPGRHGSALLPLGQTRRTVVRGQHHQTHCSQFFSALATNNGEGSPWIDDDHVIVTIVFYGDDPREYLDIGDSFSLLLGDDTCRGVVSRRLFV